MEEPCSNHHPENLQTDFKVSELRTWRFSSKGGSSKKRRCAGTHELIYINHTMSQSLNEYPQLQSRKKCASLWPSFFSLFTWELNFGQTIWAKSEVLLGTSWRTNWELGKPYGNMMIENKEEKQKIPLPTAPRKEKNWTVHECMLSLPIGYMKFLFPKLFVTIFGLG